MNRLRQQLTAQMKRTMPFRHQIFAVMAVFVVILCAGNIIFSYFMATDVEQLSARHQLDRIVRQLELSPPMPGQKAIALDANTRLYFGADNLPAGLSQASRLKSHQPREYTVPEVSSSPVYVMKSPMPVSGETQDVFILHYDESFEAIEDELFELQRMQTLIAFGLLLLSLVALLKVANQLTSPLSALADELTRRRPDNLSPLPDAILGSPSELGQLINSVNQYQAQIRQLLERERAFNRYASHELRTPLMVVQGAANLLQHSDDPAFVARQRERIQQACSEMNDFVTTLLSLTREENQENLCQRAISEQEVNAIVADHQHLLESKPVDCHVDIRHAPHVQVPESTIKILLGNLIKNAFAHTEQGEVVVSLDQDRITVTDTGSGLDNKPAGVQGYGLGLLIANDICRKYGWQFTLVDNPDGGCVACISLTPDATA